VATLIGSGSHATDIRATLQYVDAWQEFGHHKQATQEELDDAQPVIIAINNPKTRAEVARYLNISDWWWVHPASTIGPDCHYGPGTHINYGVTMTRTTLGHHCTISPGVTICGDVTIGDRTLIGAGATICDRVTIGNDVTVGAGAVVLPEATIPDGETWVGVPAKPR
jgi:acetyltransferase-like isoleucine patch superfamily enzyme